jgi:hypothetical protein
LYIRPLAWLRVRRRQKSPTYKLRWLQTCRHLSSQARSCLAFAMKFQSSPLSSNRYGVMKSGVHKSILIPQSFNSSEAHCIEPTPQCCLSYGLSEPLQLRNVRHTMRNTRLARPLSLQQMPPAMHGAYKKQKSLQPSDRLCKRKLMQNR